MKSAFKKEVRKEAGKPFGEQFKRGKQPELCCHCDRTGSFLEKLDKLEKSRVLKVGSGQNRRILKALRRCIATKANRVHGFVPRRVTHGFLALLTVPTVPDYACCVPTGCTYTPVAT